MRILAKIIETTVNSLETPVIICDFSAPRGSDLGFLDDARHLDVDFILIAYNPGKSVRMDSATVAYLIKERIGKEVIATLATRDSNRLSIQSNLLGASGLGLENLMVVEGDPFNETELALVKAVNDFKPTELIRAINAMNQGLDFKGLSFKSPTNFCVGASIDINRGIDKQVLIAGRKIQSGAEFFIAQPTFDIRQVQLFYDQYFSVNGRSIAQPIFWGVQILVENGVTFGPIPEDLAQDLKNGRDGIDIALETFSKLKELGIGSIYLVPPILKGGGRNYLDAQRFIDKVKRQI